MRGRLFIRRIATGPAGGGPGSSSAQATNRRLLSFVVSLLYRGSRRPDAPTPQEEAMSRVFFIGLVGTARLPPSPAFYLKVQVAFLTILRRFSSDPQRFARGCTA